MFSLSDDFFEVLKREFYRNTLFDYLQSLLLILVIYFSLSILKKLLLKEFRKENFKKTHPQILYFLNLFVGGLNRFFIFIWAIFLGVQNLRLVVWLDKNIHLLAIITLILYISTKIQGVLSWTIIQEIEKNKRDEQDRADPAILQIVSFAGTLFLWLMVGIVILNLLNINAATLISSLGITSIAIAFALQNVLSDIFASLSIYFDRPFAIGDSISVGADKGVVQRVGLKSTRIKTLQGEELVISNKELTTVRIKNFKNLENRRIDFKFKLDSKTPSQELRKIPSKIGKIIQSLEICEFVRAHFTTFLDEGLEFEVVYLIKSSDYKTYMDIQQKINLEIKEMLEKMQIEPKKV